MTKFVPDKFAGQSWSVALRFKNSVRRNHAVYLGLTRSEAKEAVAMLRQMHETHIDVIASLLDLNYDCD